MTLAEQFRILNVELEAYYNSLQRLRRPKKKPEDSDADDRGGIPSPLGTVWLPGSGQNSIFVDQSPTTGPNLGGPGNESTSGSPEQLGCACKNGNQAACRLIAQRIAAGDNPNMYKCRR